MSTVRWGVLAPGKIARKFAAAVVGIERLAIAAGREPEATIEAVGSRDARRAQAFLDDVDAAEAAPHGSYEALVADPTVDAVYVAAPHPFHKQLALLAIAHGKAVLCEKPLTVNAEEAQELADAAGAAGVFLMEGMWTRFLPMMQQVKKWITDGRIGAVRQVKADFCIRAPYRPEGRLFDPALAGGALLDLGVYVVSFASWVTDRRPVQVTGATAIGPTGVDEQDGMVLRYDDGALAVLTCGVRAEAPGVAAVLGTDGWIQIPHHFCSGRRALLHRSGAAAAVEFDQPLEVNGFEYQIREVSRCLAAGVAESRIMPLAESVAIMQVLDELRAQAGVAYPFDG
jgi:dihydrodiol dehydrogenase / D-xylose 1-dehydrogenase (NADP)